MVDGCDVGINVWRNGLSADIAGIVQHLSTIDYLSVAQLEINDDEFVVCCGVGDPGLELFEWKWSYKVALKDSQF